MAETIGSLIDKICIAELKIFHMREQVDRPDAAPAHREACRGRLDILTHQRNDLSVELTALARQWSQGRWVPKVYRQFKMYNDPTYKTIPPPYMRANSLLRFRVPLGFLFAGWYLWLLRYASQEMLALSVVLVILGCALRSWAAGYLLKGKRVAVGGPYAYVRNPLYVGSFIIGAGFCVALYSGPISPAVFIFWTVYVAGFVLLYAAKGHAEETELARALGPSYETYRQRVPALFPAHGKVRGLGVQRFSMELYRRNREYQCVLGSLAMLVILFLGTCHGH